MTSQSSQLRDDCQALRRYVAYIFEAALQLQNQMHSRIRKPIPKLYLALFVLHVSLVWWLAEGLWQRSYADDKALHDVACIAVAVGFSSIGLRLYMLLRYFRSEN